MSGKSSYYSIILFILFGCAETPSVKAPTTTLEPLAIQTPRSGSYAEADLLMDGILDHIDEKKKYSCIKNSQDGYLLIRTLRPHIEERESNEKKFYEEQPDYIKKTHCLKYCECSSLYSILSNENDPFWQDLLDKEQYSKCKEKWLEDICNKELFRTIQEEKVDFEVPAE